MLAIFALILVVAYISLSIYTRHGQGDIVPDIEGKYVDDVLDMESMKNYNLIIYDSIYTSGEKPGKILSQDPVQGTKIKKGRKIFIVITSQTGENIPMPNCVDQSLRWAVGQLTSVGLNIGKITFQEGDFNNVVMEQKYKNRPIATGTNLKRGEDIDLVVEISSDRFTTNVPNIIGLTEQEAQQKLWEAGLNVGKKEYEGKKDFMHSRVVSFSPNLSSITKGATISLQFLNDTKPSYKTRINSFKVAEPLIEIDTTTEDIIDNDEELLF
ncbi:MAG: PASTA domain-containing protein [Bacteroidales bacterium]|nr:PASTA domain-containing protein [Bacteroidales bacterium]